MVRRGALWFALALVAASSPDAAAHKADYLDETFVYRTVDRQVTELEYWLDLHRNEGDGFARHTLSFEFGISDHLMIDGVASFGAALGDHRLGRWRLEGRYRFGEEKPHGISPAVSFEYEDDRAEGRKTLVPRVVLNRDFEAFNITLNLLREIEVRGDDGGAWAYAVGFRYGDEEHRLRYGIELKQSFAQESRGAVIPQVWVNLGWEVTLKVGYAQRLSSHSDSFLRVVIEKELGGR